jgi:hypothetical protein
MEMTEGSYLYDQNANVFSLNETGVQNAGQISGELIQWIGNHLGPGGFN